MTPGRKIAIAGALFALVGVVVVTLKARDLTRRTSAGHSELGEPDLEVEWATALVWAAERLGIDPGNALLRDQKARVESAKRRRANDRIYDAYSKAAEAGDYETAVRRYQEIPPSSIYYWSAQKTWPEVKREYIRDHLSQARSFQAANNCSAARVHVEDVLIVDEDNDSARDVAARCPPLPPSSP